MNAAELGAPSHHIWVTGRVRTVVLEAPIFGHGTRSMYEINREDKLAGRGANVVGMQAIPPHAHNIYVQTWFELGAFGALVAAMAASSSCRQHGAIRRQIYPYLAGAAANGMMQIFPSFELWQIWYLNTLAFAVVLTACAARLSATEAEPETGGEKRVSPLPPG